MRGTKISELILPVIGLLFLPISGCKDAYNDYNQKGRCIDEVLYYGDIEQLSPAYSVAELIEFCNNGNN